MYRPHSLLSLVLLGLALILSGCEAKDREVIATEGSAAFKHAAKVTTVAWESVAKKVAEITPDSSEEAMEAARDGVASAQKKLSDIPNPTPEVTKQLESARASIAKIDAAGMIKELRTKSEQMVERARESAENVGSSLSDAKAKLEQASAEYRGLQEQLGRAKKAYEEAEKKLKDLEAP